MPLKIEKKRDESRLKTATSPYCRATSLTVRYSTLSTLSNLKPWAKARPDSPQLERLRLCDNYRVTKVEWQQSRNWVTSSRLDGRLKAIRDRCMKPETKSGRLFLNSMIFQKNNFFWTKSFFLRQLDRVWINSINSFASRQNCNESEVVEWTIGKMELQVERACVRARRPGLNAEPALHEPKAWARFKKCRYFSVTKNDFYDVGVVNSEPESLVFISPSPTPKARRSPKPGKFDPMDRLSLVWKDSGFLCCSAKLEETFKFSWVASFATRES